MSIPPAVVKEAAALRAQGVYLERERAYLVCRGKTVRHTWKEIANMLEERSLGSWPVTELKAAVVVAGYDPKTGYRR